MVRRFALTAYVLLPGVVFGQQAAPPAATPVQIRQTITALENRIGQANFDCDYKFFAQVEAEEFIFTDAVGGVTTRAEDLAGEKSCRTHKGNYELDEIRMSLEGAIVVFNARATTTVVGANGDAVVRTSRFTDVHVWRGGRWQLIAGHSSRIPPPRP